MYIVSTSDTPLVVEIKNHPHPEFNKHPFKSLLDDVLGSFFSVCHGVLNTQDIRAYIHSSIEDIGSYEMSCIFTENLITDNQLKLEIAYL